MTSTNEQFLKSKYIVKLCKVNFCISKLLHITESVNIYLCVCVSLLTPVCSACVYAYNNISEY